MNILKKYYCIVFTYSILSTSIAKLFDVHGERLLFIAIPTGLFVCFIIDEFWGKHK